LGIFLSKLGSSSDVCQLKMFLAINLWNSIVGGVLATFLSGVTDTLLPMVNTGKMVGLAINNFGDWVTILGKDLLPGPFLLPVLFRLDDILLRIALSSLLWRQTKLIDLSSDRKDLFLLLGGSIPSL
jgi:hypothetical protein